MTHGKHRARSSPVRRVLVALVVGGFAATTATVATADEPQDPNKVDTPAEALAAVESAQGQLDQVHQFLSGLVDPTSTPTTTAAPPTTTRPPRTTTPTRTRPPRTTTPRPTTTVPEPTTTTPPSGNGTTAAEKFGWGTPIAAGSDEFNYTGSPTSSKWSPYNGEGHSGNGRRVAANNTVQDGFLRQTGKSNGDSAGMASKFNQRYGKWEARVRSQGSGSGGTYHPLLIIWPQSDRWPADGEYDFLENGAPGEQCAEAFIHYPGHTPKVQEFAREKNCGAPFSEWHNVAFEWTPQFVTGYIDGKEWFKFGEADITGMPSGHLTIQLDNFKGSGMQPATYDVDWVRTYAP